MRAKNSIFTLKFIHVQFYSGIDLYPLLLRHFKFLPDTSNLLQATDSRCTDEEIVHKMNKGIHSTTEVTGALGEKGAESIVPDSGSNF